MDVLVHRLATLAGPVDAAWRAALAALGPADRARLVARLDGDRDRDPRRAAWVREAYVAIPEALDVTTPAGLERLAWVFRGGVAVPGIEPVLRAALAAGLPQGELAWTARAILSQLADAAGRPEEAEALLREVLAAARGSGTRVERGALANLVWMCMNRGREAEALVLARHTLAVMERAQDAWGEAILLDQLAHLYGWGEAWDAVARTVERLEAVAARVEERMRARVRVMIDRQRALLARAGGGYDEALALLDLAEAGVDPQREAGVMRGIDVARVRMLLDAGRVTEASARLRAIRPPADGPGVEALVLAARVAWTSGSPRDARAAAQEVLDALRARAPRPAPPALRVRAAADLVAALRGRDDVADLIAQAYDAAAGAAVERLAELEAFVRDHPEASRPTADDLRLLDGMRRRLLGEHAEMAAALTRLHRAAGREGPGALALLHDAATGMVCVCAWCQRARTKDMRWLPVQQFLPLAPRGPLEVTHGMCDECFRRLDLEEERSSGRNG